MKLGTRNSVRAENLIKLNEEYVGYENKEGKGEEIIS